MFLMLKSALKELHLPIDMHDACPSIYYLFPWTVYMCPRSLPAAANSKFMYMCYPPLPPWGMYVQCKFLAFLIGQADS